MTIPEKFQCTECKEWKPNEARWKFRIDSATGEVRDQLCTDCAPKEGTEDALDMLKRESDNQ